MLSFVRLRLCILDATKGLPERSDGSFAFAIGDHPFGVRRRSFAFANGLPEVIYPFRHRKSKIRSPLARTPTGYRCTGVKEMQSKDYLNKVKGYMCFRIPRRGKKAITSKVMIKLFLSGNLLFAFGDEFSIHRFVAKDERVSYPLPRTYPP